MLQDIANWVVESSPTADLTAVPLQLRVIAVCDSRHVRVEGATNVSDTSFAPRSGTTWG